MNAGTTSQLVNINLSRKYAEAVPCHAEEYIAQAAECQLLSHSFTRHKMLSTVQSDNGAQYTIHLTQEFVLLSHLIIVLSEAITP